MYVHAIIQDRLKMVIALYRSQLVHSLLIDGSD